MGTPGEPPPGLPQHHQRREGESSRGTTQQPQCRNPRQLQRRAHRARRTLFTPEQIQPWTPRPQDISLPKQRPDRAQGSRPRQAATGIEPAHTKAPSPRHQEPQVHQQAERPSTGRECGGVEIGPTFDGGPKLIQEKEQSQSHIPTLMRTHKNTQHKNTHTHAPNLKTNNNGCCTLTLPIHTLYSQVQVPIPHRGNQSPDPGGPLPSRGRDRQTAPTPEPGPRPPAPTPVPNDPHPHAKRGSCTKEGSTWSKLARQPEQHRMK
ncbi:hypothetical protein ATANTOWER_032382 [Ataeniobius toweri]|uniref:Uncharacterized protein n=1 Tax=Ataeniobius toweri TaxID=208326 RepID=A0ABU7BXU4_9TELE|nr:hypothetical protein [Ataeniobius toweri]